MNKHLPYLLLTLSLCLGSIFYSYSSTNRKNTAKQKAKPQLTYENEFFSIACPSGWDYEEEINNEYENHPKLSKGIRVTFYPITPNAKWQTVMVQKSAMPGLYSTPEEGRDASVALKQFDKQYLGTIDSYMVDSLHFGPYPAAMAGFVVATEEGDTIVHKQTIVVTDDKEIYYLNNSFDWHDNGTLEEAGDNILSTLKFKPKEATKQ